MTFAVTLGLDTLSFMLALLLVTLGLVVIFGLMNVINMAHGEFFLIGAYCVVLIQKIGLSYWWALLLAPIVLIAVGLIVEELVIRHIYRRFVDSILATWGISLVLKQLIVIVFGATAQSVDSPIPGPVEILGVTYPAYRLFIMGVAIALSSAMFLLFYCTPIGLAVRGVIANRTMAASLGINTRRLDRATFAIGAGIAGVAGAVMAPIMSVDPQMGVGFLIPAFLSILVGGSGTLLGALTGTAVISSTSVLVSDVWTQVVAQVVVFTLSILVIRFFPRGITGRRS
jgi:urea transport system permease protein